MAHGCWIRSGSAIQPSSSFESLSKTQNNVILRPWAASEHERPFEVSSQACRHPSRGNVHLGPVLEGNLQLSTDLMINDRKIPHLADEQRPQSLSAHSAMKLSLIPWASWCFLNGSK